MLCRGACAKHLSITRPALYLVDAMVVEDRVLERRSKGPLRNEDIEY